FAHRTVAGGTSKTDSHYRATGRSSGIVVETDSRSAPRRLRRAPSGHARGCAYSCGGAAKADPKRIHRCRLVPPQTFTAAGRRCAGWRRRGRKASAGTTIIRKTSKAAGKQFVPPDPEPPKNPDPALIVEPSVIAPQLASLPHLNLLNIGDPDGVPGPPSAGSGNGYGIGPGDGHGDGPGNGPGVGPGEDGGFGRDVFHIGGSISSPVL